MTIVAGKRADFEATGAALVDPCAETQSAAVEGVRQAAVISANAGRQDCIRRRTRPRRPEMLP